MNRKCPLNCPSCSAAATPLNNKELSPLWLTEFFNRLKDLEFPGYITWTGGEPFLSFKTLKTGIELAAEAKYHSEILTGGAWFDNNPGLLKQLRAVGNFSLRISLDAEHQEKIPLRLIFALIEAALRLNVEVNFTLRSIPGREAASFYKDAIKKALPDFYRKNRGRSRWIHTIPHIGTVPEKERTPACAGAPLPASGKWQNSCRQGFRDLVIGEDGLFYPCCGLFTLSCYRRLAVGDPLKESWPVLLNKQNRKPLFRVLKEKGPYFICLELGKQLEIRSSSFNNPCDVCLALFRRYGEEVLALFDRG